MQDLQALSPPIWSCCGTEILYKEPKAYHSFSQADESENIHLVRHHDTPEPKQSDAPQGLSLTEVASREILVF